MSTGPTSGRFYNPTRRHSALGYISPISTKGRPKRLSLVSTKPGAAQSIKADARTSTRMELSWGRILHQIVADLKAATPAKSLTGAAGPTSFKCRKHLGLAN